MCSQLRSKILQTQLHKKLAFYGTDLRVSTAPVMRGLAFQIEIQCYRLSFFHVAREVNVDMIMTGSFLSVAWKCVWNFRSWPRNGIPQAAVNQIMNFGTTLWIFHVRSKLATFETIFKSSRIGCHFTFEIFRCKVYRQTDRIKNILRKTFSALAYLKWKPFIGVLPEPYILRMLKNY